MPHPLLGGIERVTVNLTKRFNEMGITVYNICEIGDNADLLLPSEETDENKAKLVEEFLIANDIPIIIDQYGKNYLTHPAISKNIKIIRCNHNNPFQKHIIRGLWENMDILNFKESILNLAFILNTPRRKAKSLNFLKSFRSTALIDKLILLSNNFVKPFSEKYGIPMAYLSALPNAAEISLEQRSLNMKDLLNENISIKENQLVWCGRMVQNPKNIYFLIRLWKKLSPKYPNWKLIVVGDGIDRNKFEQRIKKNQLKNIELKGLTNPYPFYEKAKILLLPSYSEGFPMVLIEAMSHGCVPIVFDCTLSYTDIIDTGTNGIIVPDLDDNAFVNACDQLMSDEKLFDCMSKNAINIIDRYSMAKVSQMWLELFRDVLKK